MQRDLPELDKRKIGLAAISYDSPEILAEFAARKRITFPLLSDLGSKTIRAYGLLNETVKPDSFAFGIPNPGTLVLDGNGKVIAKYAEADFRERVTIPSILERQTGLPAGPETKIEAKHLSVSLRPSNAVVSSGQKLTLSIEGILPLKMHVYAPGVKGYKPISWTLDESAAYKLSDVEFPASEVLRLPVIDEIVPVFRGRFVLRRDLTIAMPPVLLPLLDADGNLLVKGSLRYQACDDKECYLPESVAVVWKFHWEPFDSKRSREPIRHK